MNLENRVARLEAGQAKADMERMNDEELDAYILTLEDGCPSWYDAIIARVMRHPSAFPVVHDDPAHKVDDGQRDAV